jgi:hypothetical protein
MTTDLATTGAQVVPVLALGAVLAYRARSRAHDQLVGPMNASVRQFSQRVVELHDDQGLRGLPLLDAIARLGGGVGTTYVLRLLAVVGVLVTVAANLVAELLCLAVLSQSVAARPWQAAWLLASITAGLVLLVVVPILSAGPSWASPFGALRSPEYARARAIIEQASRTHE